MRLGTQTVRFGRTHSSAFRGRLEVRFVRLRSQVTVLLWLLAGATLACSQNEYVAPPPPTVTVANPVVQDVTDYLAYTGRARAVESVQVQARVKGFLESMHYVPGTR